MSMSVDAGVSVERVKELEQEVKELTNEIKRLRKCKKYGLVWEEHEEELDKKNVIPLLAKDESLSLPEIADKPMNYLIEGDNYHALKALQHTHRGRIDVIYIDPPYNTGNRDFVYNDKYVDSEDNFRHSKWLSFMNKRLKLARELMSDDGVIFISIDDNEQAQLKLLCDEIFGEENYINTLVWERTTHYGRQTKNCYVNAEYVLVYAKYKYASNGEIKNLLIDSIQDVFEDAPLYNGSNNAKTLVFKEGSVEFNIPDGVYKNGVYGKYTLLDDVCVVDGVNENPFRMKFKSRWSQDKLNEQLMLGGKALIKSDSFAVRFVYGNRDKHIKAVTKLLNASYGTNQQASSDLFDLFDGRSIFDYSKPVSLIKYLIKVSTLINKSAIVLDFFAGSGTTGHAVMELNKEDGWNRSFILCTNNEVSDERIRTYLFEQGIISKNNKTEFDKYKKNNSEGYQNFLKSPEYESLGIARAVTRERLKRVIEGYTTPKGKKVEALPNNLTYLKTQEFDKNEQFGLNRKQLADLAFNSHLLKYPESDYQSIKVDIFTDLSKIQHDKSKKLVAFIDVRDRESLSDIVDELTERFGNHIEIETLESYFN